MENTFENIVKFANDEDKSHDELYQMAWAYYLRSHMSDLEVKLTYEEQVKLAQLAEYCWLKFDYYSMDDAFNGLVGLLNSGDFTIDQLLEMDKWELNKHCTEYVTY